MDLVEYAEFLVKSICKEPDMVRVQRFDSDDGITLEIMVLESDMGIVIGRSGKVASSLRVLLQAYAYLNKLGKVKVNIESF